MAKYNSVSVPVDAYQLTLVNLPTIISWMGSAYTQHTLNGSKQTITLPLCSSIGTITTTTGDWLIRDGSGNFSRCPDGSFQKLYTYVSG